MKTTVRLAWSRRPQREQTIAADRRIWRERSGRYRIVESRSLFNHGHRVWFALRLARYGDRQCWSILSRHRTRRAALRVCQRHAARDGRQPWMLL